MKRTIQNIVLLVGILNASNISGQDTLKLVGGDERIVTIVELDSKSLSYYEFEDESKSIYTIPMDMVLKLSRRDDETHFVKPMKNQKMLHNQKRIRNALYTELLGPGGFISLNYDMRLKIDDHFGIGGRVGVGGTFMVLGSSSSVIFELNTSYNFKNNYLVFGMGQVTTESSFIFSETKYAQGLLIDLSYRYMAPKVGFFFQASINPVIYPDDEFASIPLGIGMGLAF